MLILLGLSFVKIALGVLYTSITVIVCYILYKRLLRYMNKDVPNKALYCELISLEQDPAKGMLEFYFTSLETKTVSFEILDESYNSVEVLAEKDFNAGQHIVRFDSTKVSNGVYYYQLKTDNQQTMKMMHVAN
jgi:hypothetical protein